MQMPSPFSTRTKLARNYLKWESNRGKRQVGFLSHYVDYLATKSAPSRKHQVGREMDVYSLVSQGGFPNSKCLRESINSHLLACFARFNKLASTLDSMKATFKKNTPKQRDQLAGKGNGKVVGKKGNKKPKQNAA